MGALQGTVTVRRYLVRGDKPKDPNRLLKGVRAHALVPIDPRSDVEKVAGWASLADPTDLDLTAENVFFGPSVGLALRVDALVPPAAVVKRLVAEKLKQSGRRASRAEKQAVKDEVKKSLRSRYLPTIRATDLVWQTDTGQVFLWSHAKATNELAIDLFYKSFGLELVPNGPGLVAGRGTIPAGTEPTPELVFGFPGLPGREQDEDEAVDEEMEEHADA
jgi:DNA recombination-dependent growth factor C